MTDYIRDLRPAEWGSGVGWHSSNLEPLMSALGHKRTFKRLLDMLVSTPGKVLKLTGITMKLPRRKFLTCALALGAAALVEVFRIDAWSQSTRPIRVVLPFAPGGPADAMARLLAEQIGSAGGPTMVVESRPGAGTEIATEYVSRADPDAGGKCGANFDAILRSQYEDYGRIIREISFKRE